MVHTGQVTRELEIWTKSERLEYKIRCCIVSNKKEVESTTTNFHFNTRVSIHLFL
jgi:hypothetical protein